MCQMGCRLWSLSVLSVLVLTGCNILLTVRLLHSSSDCPRPSLPEPPPQPPQAQVETFDQQTSPCHHSPSDDSSVSPSAAETALTSSLNNSSKPTEFRLDLRLGRWDSHRLYRFFDWVSTGTQYAELSHRYSVCLATQSSLDRLHSLVQLAHQWAGPISAAIFIAAPDELVIVKTYVSFLRRCYAPVKNRVSFHFAVPRDHPTSFSTSRSGLTPGIEREKLDCLKPEASLRLLLRHRRPEAARWRVKLPYPQNHMRNLARRNCQTNNVFVTDVDIVPSSNLAERLDVFLRTQHCDNMCAYVIPTYELDERVRFPQNKSELVRLARKGLARPFHHKVFIYNQFATNFSRWQAAQETKGEVVHISHNVTNFEFLYEPFYVAPDTVPAHDERFIGYGYTRNTQVYETFVAGFQFQVLSPIFTVHWGLQNKKGRPGWRERQNSLNRRHFEVFKREVFARYQRDPLRMLTPRKHIEGPRLHMP